MTIEELKKKIKYGDYNTLAEMLETTVAAAKARLNRKDTEAIEAMALILENREKLIHEFQNK